MSRIILTVFILVSAWSSAGGDDHTASWSIFAPSRSEGVLHRLVLKVSAKDEASLEVVDSNPIELQGRSIAQHPTKPIIYVSGSPKKGGTVNFGSYKIDRSTESISELST
ncbi:MAG: hypothetical protein AAF357_11650, partial [Verrucomicrobiota bacterium]